MAIPVLIMGKSGSGKSASMRSLPQETSGIINVLGKPLPFRGRGMGEATTDYERIRTILKGAKCEVIVIDDAGYLITHQFMAGHASHGGGNAVFALYNQMADNFYSLVTTISLLPGDKRVYIMMHEDTDEAGNVKPKTIGKLLDDKVCIQGMVAICIRCMVIDGQHRFVVNGMDAAKSPRGLFESDQIDNDLAFVDDKICAYYEIGKYAPKGELPI
jgi:hypothetical protein